MKGFIEVTNYEGKKVLINITFIKSVFNNVIFFESSSCGYKESYKEIKCLIEEAQSNDEDEDDYFPSPW